MRRLTVLLPLVLSLGLVVSVAHAGRSAPVAPTAHAAKSAHDRDGDGVADANDQCPDAYGGNGGCPPSDRDGDLRPDSDDKCPDTYGQSYNGGCPQQPGNRDADGVPDANDACPESFGEGANGCDPWVFKYFFGLHKGVKEFAADDEPVSDTAGCSGGPAVCTTAHLTMTLSAQTAKAASIKDRHIGSLELALPWREVHGPKDGWSRGISRADGRKLARLKKIVVTIRAWVVLTTGEKVETPAATIKIVGNKMVLHQFSTDGTNPNEN